jgi:threonyl-tRNA synthetase
MSAPAATPAAAPANEPQQNATPAPANADGAAPPPASSSSEPKKSRGQLNNEKGKAKAAKKKEAKEAGGGAEGEEGAAAAPKEKVLPTPWVMPVWMAHRVKIWDEASERRKAEENIEERPIKITLPDGKELEGVAGKTTAFDIAKGISNSLAERIVVAKVRRGRRRHTGRREGGAERGEGKEGGHSLSTTSQQFHSLCPSSPLPLLLPSSFIFFFFLLPFVGER